MAAALFSSSQTTTGLLFGVAAFLIWSLGDSCTRLAGQADIPAIQIVVLSSLMAMGLCAIATTGQQGGLKRLWPKSLKLQFVYGLISIVASLANMTAFKHLPLPTVYCAFFASPLLTAAYGFLFLGEPLSKKEAVLIGLGFIGTLIALNPLQSTFEDVPVYLYGILALLPITFTAGILFLRVLGQTDTVESLTFFQLMVRSAFLAPWLAFDWKPMEAIHYAQVLGMGLMMGLGNMLITIGLKKVPSTVMSPVAYSQLFIGALLGFLIWQEVPSEVTIAGSVLIITTGLAGARIAAQREKQLACC